MKKHLFSLLAALSMFAVLVLPASAEMSLSAGQTSMSNGGKTVTVDLTFTCAFSGNYSVYGSLYQTSGRLLNLGQSGTWGTCVEGEQVTASMAIPSSFGTAFKAGPAQLVGQVYVDSYNYETYEYLYDSGQVTATIRLKK